MEITDRDRARMNNTLIQFWRFVVLNLRTLKAVTHSKQAQSPTLSVAVQALSFCTLFGGDHAA